MLQRRSLFSDGRIATPHDNAVASSGTPAERLQQMASMARETIDTTAADLRFVLDKVTQLNKAAKGPSIFVGRLDFDRVAVVGHSAGGAAAARACQLDQRFKACVSLDGEVNPEGAFFNYPNAKSPSQPFLLIEVDQPEPTNEELARMLETRAQWDEFLRSEEAQLRACPGGSYHVMLKGRGIIHASFSDYPLFASANRPTDNQIALYNLQLTGTITRSFLDKYLKQQNQPLFDGGRLPPEMTVRKF
jgi:pimeloyl-ACP methyl ester carboxylesterase